MVCIGCNENKHKVNQEKISEDIITDIYYEISSNYDDENKLVYMIESTDFTISDSSHYDVFRLYLNKKVIAEKDSVVYFFSLTRLGYNDFRNENRFTRTYQNEYQLYGDINGIHTVIDGDIRSSYRVFKGELNPVYYGHYVLMLNDYDIQSLKDIDDLVLSYKTEEKSEIGSNNIEEFKISSAVLDTIKMMIKDNWKDQLKRVQEQSN